jgi:hypothetical protein
MSLPLIMHFIASDVDLISALKSPAANFILSVAQNAELPGPMDPMYNKCLERLVDVIAIEWLRRALAMT